LEQKELLLEVLDMEIVFAWRTRALMTEMLMKIVKSLLDGKQDLELLPSFLFASCFAVVLEVITFVIGRGLMSCPFKT
jgi:hypothetical protein